MKMNEEDIVAEQPIKTNLKLTDKEMNDIYDYMRKINIVSYSDKFEKDLSTYVKPFKAYNLKIKYDSKEKNIYWEDRSGSSSEKVNQLRELIGKIENIISNKEEYKKLPDPKGSYK